MFRLILSALIIYALLSGCNKKVDQPAATDTKPVRIGFMICNSKEETEARFRPLTEWLSGKLGRRFEAVTIDTVDVEQAVRDGQVEFTHTNSLLYVILNKNYGVEVLGADIKGRHGYKSNGAIVVLKDSPIKTLKDLKDKRMVFGPMLAPTGYLSQYDMMLKDGFDPEEGLAFYTIPKGSFKHDKVIYSLLFGAYDAASVPMLDFELMSKDGRIDPEDFRIIAESEPIPYCTFSVTEGVDDALAKQVKDALLSLKPEDTVEYDGERVKVLKAAMLDGIADVKDSEYDPVREMARRCNMPPYQKF
ncbi:MAG: phosphate/phosphite/phosphonate ABC transporter substrate-binding protein [Nitrospirae bacterium]|nr:phosphate/phosphite/phosphonate ABC transporter substrate-binding protein [Nitrospirota bacterium]MBI5696638.1 phosphate/phosphite/phosphonate ABC transporter substrate-binding protein [Nitrospirota bacterium]